MDGMSLTELLAPLSLLDCVRSYVNHCVDLFPDTISAVDRDSYRQLVTTLISMCRCQFLSGAVWNLARQVPTEHAERVRP